MIFRCCSIILVLALTAPTAMAQSAAVENSWTATTLSDLDAMRTWIVENHPGFVDSNHQKFRRQLRRSYHNARQLAVTATSFAGYAATLDYFAAGFNDPHIVFQGVPQPDPTLISTLEWPGFVVAYRQQKIVVHAVANAALLGPLPDVGTTLIGCDGQYSASIVRQDILPFSQINLPNAECAWTIMTPLMLVDEGNPFVRRPASCTFAGATGFTTIDLAWQKTTPNLLMPLLTSAQTGSPPTMALRSFGANSYWLQIPSFAANSADQVAAFQQFIALLTAQQDKLHAADKIVIDVRGNGGGSTEWTNGVIAALWGNDVEQFYTPSGEHAWRVSPGNYQFLTQVVLPEIASAEGVDSSDYLELQTEAADFKLALARGDSLLPIADNAAAGTASAPPANPVAGNVYFLTDAWCSSSCLLFADTILRIPGVTQVGQPTGADTRYNEIRRELLPSGHGYIQGPQKVYFGRPRADDVAYTPKLRWHGEMSDTAGLQAWIDAF